MDQPRWTLTDYLNGTIPGQVVSERWTHKRRWSVGKEIVYHTDGRFFRVRLDVPATESQEWEDNEDLDITEVVPVSQLITVYQPKED